MGRDGVTGLAAGPESNLRDIADVSDVPWDGYALAYVSLLCINKQIQVPRVRGVSVCAYWITADRRSSSAPYWITATPLCLCPRLPHLLPNLLASKDRPALGVLRPASVLDVGEAVRLQVFLRLLATPAAAAVRDDRGRLVLAVQRREVHRRGGAVEDDVDRSLAARVSDLCGLVCLAVARLLLKVRVADVDNDQITARLFDKAGQLLRRAHTRFAAHDGKGAGERRVRRGGAGERSGERSAGTEGWEEHGEAEHSQKLGPQRPL
mmetsp:Transcript_20539/g.60820  ORF Transcript_20539/g.60820 Transcript_20539/m.60820 type:complete len:265 (+) Transcript_20539:354-1148(+)